MARAKANPNPTEEEKVTTETEAVQVTTEPKRQKKERMDETELVPVRSRVRGSLVYISRAGERFIWEKYDDEELMEIKELRTMNTRSRKFFERGLIEIMDEEVQHYLNVDRYQNQVMDEDALESLLNQEPEVVEEALKNTSKNNRRLVLAFAREKYVNRQLPNSYVKDAIEKALGESVSP